MINGLMINDFAKIGFFKDFLGIIMSLLCLCYAFSRFLFVVLGLEAKIRRMNEPI